MTIFRGVFSCCVLSMCMLQITATPPKTRLNIEGKRAMFVTLNKIDEANKEVWFKNERGELVTRRLSIRTMRTFQHFKVGQRLLVFERVDTSPPLLNDECWKIGNSACGGSDNDPCPSSDFRRIYYKCIDDDGNETYYDDCEPDECFDRPK